MSQEYPFEISGSVRPLVQPAVGSSEPKTALTARDVPALNLPALNALALRSLVSLFDAKEKLFCGRAAMTNAGLHREEASRRSTIVALLGLRRLAESEGEQIFDLAAIRDVVLADTKWVKGVGDLGLLIWFTAEFVPGRLRELFNEFNLDEALETYSDGCQARTSRLAWFLAGISHARLASPRSLPDLTDVAVDTYHLLLENQGEGGLFGHAVRLGFVQRGFCNRFGTFGDQAYSIYALAMFARAFQVEEPLAPALNCANSIRALQGERGEWWFLYDKRACRVTNRYPVFSCQQDGIAPVSLAALEEATGQNFHETIYKGLSWSTGQNEHRNNLRNPERCVTWDSIWPKSHRAIYWETALSVLNVPRSAREGSLAVRYEARPDHFGWLLYAFGSQGLPRGLENSKAMTTGE